MNTVEIKQDIKDQIAKIDLSFGNWQIFRLNELKLDNINLLEGSLRRMKRYFNFYMIGAVLLSVILLGLSFNKLFEIFDNIDLNKSGLTILLALAFSVNAFASYKLTVKLENKIYLLKLLNSI